MVKWLLIILLLPLTLTAQTYDFPVATPADTLELLDGGCLNYGPPTLKIYQTGPHAVRLAAYIWSEFVDTVYFYRGTSPYFVEDSLGAAFLKVVRPPRYIVINAYDTTAAIGNVNVNHFYYCRGVDVGSSGARLFSLPSNRVGEMDFTLSASPSRTDYCDFTLTLWPWWANANCLAESLGMRVSGCNFIGHWNPYTGTIDPVAIRTGTTWLDGATPLKLHETYFLAGDTLPATLSLVGYLTFDRPDTLQPDAGGNYIVQTELPPYWAKGYQIDTADRWGAALQGAGIGSVARWDIATQSIVTLSTYSGAWSPLGATVRPGYPYFLTFPGRTDPLIWPQIGRQPE